MADRYLKKLLVEHLLEAPGVTARVIIPVVHLQAAEVYTFKVLVETQVQLRHGN
jgi:hypothetical protein